MSATAQVTIKGLAYTLHTERHAGAVVDLFRIVSPTGREGAIFQRRDTGVCIGVGLSALERASAADVTKALAGAIDGAAEAVAS